ncbi:MAG TPA: hypothetical protein PKK06_12085 [Phycisphaerae bacterium]|nr:hypothetical protein [Phycisphaerae bacterium]HNU46350.1 hypothetical protein [Phycisphaerae bacterium]
MVVVDYRKRWSAITLRWTRGLRSAKRGRILALAVGGALAMGLTPAVAQVGAQRERLDDYARLSVVPIDFGRYGISSVDAYGNATANWKEVREASFFFNLIQARGLRSYQTIGRAPDQLPIYHDMRAAQLARLGLEPAPDPDRQQREERWLWHHVYGPYGGFGQRVGEHLPKGVNDLVARKPLMLQAAGLTGPVRRTLLQSGPSTVPIVRPGTVEWPAAAVAEVTPPVAVPLAEGRPLSLCLAAARDAACERSIQEAWTWFTEGRFREAARLLSGASALRPDDVSVRLAEVFARVSAGQLETAAVIVEEIVRRELAPFGQEMAILDRYDDRERGRRVRQETDVYAQALRKAVVDDADPKRKARAANAGALHVLVLWYLGERDLALGAAETLSRNFPDTVYARWPVQMRAAREAAAAQP